MGMYASQVLGHEDRVPSFKYQVDSQHASAFCTRKEPKQWLMSVPLYGLLMHNHGISSPKRHPRRLGPDRRCLEPVPVLSAGDQVHVRRLAADRPYHEANLVLIPVALTIVNGQVSFSLVSLIQTRLRRPD